MEWEAPAIILAVRPFGEGDAIATVMTAEHGAHRGLARGGSSRGRAALWQPGNLAQVRWVGRLAEQLGSLSGELVHPAAALAMDDPLRLAMLIAACALAEGALPEREAHPRLFDGLLSFIARLAGGAGLLAEQVRWEALLLAELGFGLDLHSCPVTGATEGLVYASPKSGRAFTAEGAGKWASRMLPLPAFLLGEGEGNPAEWRDGLRLTGYFLARDVFGLRHLPLPAARVALYDRVAGLAELESDV
jgi:DNA repair protein RecO (recombination protein O)